MISSRGNYSFRLSNVTYHLKCVYNLYRIRTDGIGELNLGNVDQIVSFSLELGMRQFLDLEAQVSYYK